MVVLVKVKKNIYRDSLLLMQIAAKIRKLKGILDVSVMSGTDQNKESLRATRLFTEEIKSSSPNDVFITVEAESIKEAGKALEKAEEMLSAPRVIVAEGERVTRTLRSALKLLPDANLALISIPGPFVKREAMKALKENLNLLIFSSNVPIEDEIEIKRLGRKSGLLVMGPDCGTAIIGGVALGFANKVRRGPIGVVGAAGTGIQEVSSLIHQHGSGITHAIGTGSNDVTEEVGAITMMEGLKRLDRDSETRVIVLVSKSPAIKVQMKVLDVLKNCEKPVIVNFLGGEDLPSESVGLIPARTLEDAALKAVAIATGREAKIAPFSADRDEILELAKKEFLKLSDGQKYIRGLFSGGTFASESSMIIADLIGEVHTNMALKSAVKLINARQSVRHTCVDLGAEEFTVGKPHPMLEPAMREERLIIEAKDPGTAVILLDFVLGYGVHEDPVGALIPILEKAKALAEAQGRYLPVVASVCGTDEDPQNRSLQKKKLEDAGIIVMPSNAQATRMAALIAMRASERPVEHMLKGRG